MALVAYDYGDSDSEEETTNDTDSPPALVSVSNGIIFPPTKIDKKLAPKTTELQSTTDKITKSEVKATNYEKPKVRITIPSLSQFGPEDSQPAIQKPRPSTKGSGLLAILPPVKGTILTAKSFIPNSLKNKPSTSSKNAVENRMLPHAVKRKADMLKQASLAKIARKSATNDDESDADDDTDIPETFNEKLWEQTCGRPLKKYKEVIHTTSRSLDDFEQPNIDIAPEPSRPVDGLDNEAFKQLVGKSKRPLNIKLIDVNEDEVLAEKDLWLTRSLTDPEHKPKPEIEEVVDPTRKKKHHITYLAEMAKANEEEFANSWSASKFTRNQTRAKYGF